MFELGEQKVRVFPKKIFIPLLIWTRGIKMHTHFCKFERNFFKIFLQRNWPLHSFAQAIKNAYPKWAASKKCLQIIHIFSCQEIFIPSPIWTKGGEMDTHFRGFERKFFKKFFAEKSIPSLICTRGIKMDTHFRLVLQNFFNIF